VAYSNEPVGFCFFLNRPSLETKELQVVSDSRRAIVTAVPVLRRPHGLVGLEQRRLVATTTLRDQEK